jgi:hypothetical protein
MKTTHGDGNQNQKSTNYPFLSDIYEIAKANVIIISTNECLIPLFFQKARTGRGGDYGFITKQQIIDMKQGGSCMPPTYSNPDMPEFTNNPNIPSTSSNPTANDTQTDPEGTQGFKVINTFLADPFLGQDPQDDPFARTHEH